MTVKGSIYLFSAISCETPERGVGLGLCVRVRTVWGPVWRTRALWLMAQFPLPLFKVDCQFALCDLVTSHLLSGWRDNVKDCGWAVWLWLLRWQRDSTGDFIAFFLLTLGGKTKTLQFASKCEHVEADQRTSQWPKRACLWYHNLSCHLTLVKSLE